MPDKHKPIMVDLGLPKNRRALIFTLIVAMGTWLSTVFHYFLGVYRKYPYPRNTFLFRPDRRFDDFYGDLDRASRFVQGLDFDIPYTPFATTVMAALSLIPVQKIAFGLAAGGFMLASFLIVWNLIANELKSVGLRMLVCGVLVTMSYPILFVVDRGNEEMFVFLAIAGFTFLHLKKRSNWAAVLLGAAIAYKIYPAVLLVMLIADRKWKALGIAIATAFGLMSFSTLLLSWLSGYGLVDVITHWYSSLFVGHLNYANTFGAHQHGHSLWGVIAVATKLLSGQDPADAIRTIYVVVVLAVFLAIAAYVVFVEREDWRRVTLLIVAMILLPFESHDYTLIHLLIPIALFMNSRREPWDLALVAAFGLLSIPFDYVLIVKEVSISTFTYPLTLIAICVVVIAQRFLRPQAQDG